jgi:hypothetical protein
VHAPDGNAELADPFESFFDQRLVAVMEGLPAADEQGPVGRFGSKAGRMASVFTADGSSSRAILKHFTRLTDDYTVVGYSTATAINRADPTR